MAFLAVAGAGLFGGGVFGSLAFNAVLGLGMIGLSYYLQSRQKITGPRLEDLEVKDTPTGSPVPLHYGLGAFYAIPIWIKDNKLIEKSTTTRQGKGGPKVTTYSYYVTGAWVICDNLQAALQKLWMNSKVIIDKYTTENSFDTALSGVRYNLYLGTEDQMPDPWMEASLGVGNTPAYRGTSYIVFNELPLKDAGNVIPQIRVQMVSDGALVGEGPNYPQPGGSSRHTTIRQDQSNPDKVILVQRGVGGDVYKYYIASGDKLPANGLVPSIQVGGTNKPWTTDKFGRYYILTNADELEAYSSASFGLLATYPHEGLSTGDVYVFDRPDGTQWIVMTNLTGGGPFGSGRHLVTSILLEGGNYDTGIIGGDPFANINKLYLIGDVFVWVTSEPYDGNKIAVDHNDFLWAWGTSGTDGQTKKLTVIRLGVSSYLHHDFPVNPEGYVYKNFTYGFGSDFSAPTYLGMDIRAGGYFQDEACVVFIGHKDGDPTKNVMIRKYDPDPTTGGYYIGELSILDEVELPNTGSAFHGGMLTQNLGSNQNGFKDGIAVIAMGDKTVYKIDLATMSIAYTVDPAILTAARAQVIYIPQMDAAIMWNSTEPPVLIYFGKINANLISLKTIVDDVDSRVGMPAERSETTDIAPVLLTGYTMQDTSGVSDALSDMITILGVEIADWGAYIKWIVRGDQVPVTIDPEDLGTSEGVDPADYDLKINVSEGWEMPKVMQLKHYDPEAEFEVSLQEAYRHSAVVASVDTTTVNTKVILQADIAASKLRNIFKAMWRARTTYELFLPPRYRRYTAGDVMEVTYNGLTHQFMINEATFDEGLVSVKGTAENVDDWNADVPGQSVVVPPGIIDSYSQPVLWLLNVNALRDDDVDFKFYVATHALTPDKFYPGVYVLRGSDPGALVEWLAFTAIVKFGTTLIPPGNCPYPQMIDFSTMRVLIDNAQNFSPASVTIEQLWNDSTLNPAMILSQASDGTLEAEFIQYATVTYLGDDQWEISDMIRGLRGTEHMIGRHNAGSTILFPTPTTLYREGNSENVGVLKYYQPNTIGKELPSSNLVQPFTNTSKALRPYSPDSLTGTRTLSGDLVIDWKRRAKIYNTWTEGVELALDESVEQYNLYIYEDDTKAVLLRQQLITSASTYTYTLANYNSDASAAESVVPTVYVEVGQIGDVYGEGVLTGGDL